MKPWLALLGTLAAACATVGSDEPDAAPVAVDADPTPDVSTVFTPRLLGSGLVLWLDASLGVAASGPAVVTWNDQSGKNNHAASGAARPLLVSSLVNGLPAIRFDGAGTFVQMPDSDSLQWGTGDFTLVMVVAVRNTQAAYAMLYGKTLQPSPFTGPCLFANWPRPASTKLGTQLDYSHFAIGGTAGLNDGKFRVLGMRRTAGTVEVRVNGVSDGTAPADLDISAAGAQPTLGGQAKIVQMLDGDIAEVVAVKGALGADDLARLEGYLKTKYGL